MCIYIESPHFLAYLSLKEQQANLVAVNIMTREKSRKTGSGTMCNFGLRHTFYSSPSAAYKSKTMIKLFHG